MDHCCLHSEADVFMLRNSFPLKSVCFNSINHLLPLQIRVPKSKSLPAYCRTRSVLVKASGKNPSSSTSGKGNSDNSNAEDGLKGNNSLGSNNSGDPGPKKSQPKALDWREFRALLYHQEQAASGDFVHDQDGKSSGSNSLPLKWAHPISTLENGCLLVATEKLDGVRSFERTVVLLLRSGARSPQDEPLGIIINRPLNKKWKHMPLTSIALATIFGDCSLNFGGPLDANTFLLRGGETKLSELEEVIPGMYFGSRNSMDEAGRLVTKGKFSIRDFRFFAGYAGWQLDQLREEIDSEYWYIASCSANLISEVSKNSSSEGLWEEILQLMGGHYSELSRKPKRDI